MADETVIPEGRGKAAAMKSFLATGAGRVSRGGDRNPQFKYQEGKIKGKTQEQAESMFERLWEGASKSIKNKYAKRGSTTGVLAPSEQADYGRRRGGRPQAGVAYGDDPSPKDPAARVNERGGQPIKNSNIGKGIPPLNTSDGKQTSAVHPHNKGYEYGNRGLNQGAADRRVAEVKTDEVKKDTNSFVANPDDFGKLVAIGDGSTPDAAAAAQEESRAVVDEAYARQAAREKNQPLRKPASNSDAAFKKFGQNALHPDAFKLAKPVDEKEPYKGSGNPVKTPVKPKPSPTSTADKPTDKPTAKPTATPSAKSPRKRIGATPEGMELVGMDANGAVYEPISKVYSGSNPLDSDQKIRDNYQTGGTAASARAHLPPTKPIAGKPLMPRGPASQRQEIRQPGSPMRADGFEPEGRQERFDRKNEESEAFRTGKMGDYNRKMGRRGTHSTYQSLADIKAKKPVPDGNRTDEQQAVAEKRQYQKQREALYGAAPSPVKRPGATSRVVGSRAATLEEVKRGKPLSLPLTPKPEPKRKPGLLQRRR